METGMILAYFRASESCCLGLALQERFGNAVVAAMLVQMGLFRGALSR